MLPDIQERCRNTILGLLSLNKDGLTIAGIYRVITQDLPGICSRQDFANVIVQLESESLIDSEHRPGRGTRRVYFLPVRGARVRIIPAASAPLPPMPKRTWLSALGMPALDATAWVAPYFPKGAA